MASSSYRKLLALVNISICSVFEGVMKMIVQSLRLSAVRSVGLFLSFSACRLFGYLLLDRNYLEPILGET